MSFLIYQKSKVSWELSAQATCMHLCEGGGDGEASAPDDNSKLFIGCSDQYLRVVDFQVG